MVSAGQQQQQQPAASMPSFPLIGIDGATFLSKPLTERKPQEAVPLIRKATGLRQQHLTTPLLGLVDQLGISRYEAHRGILLAAKHALLAQISSTHSGSSSSAATSAAGLGLTGGGASSGVGGVSMATVTLQPSLSQATVEDRLRLERLLGASFKYLNIAELREVPLAVMEKLEQVPTMFLKELAVDKTVFRDLPAKVQRQVWEYDKNLLQAHALPPVGQYKYEVATIMRGLALDEFLPAATQQLQVARTAAEKKALGDAAGAGAGPLEPQLLRLGDDDADGLLPTGRAAGPGGPGMGAGGWGRKGGGVWRGVSGRPVTRKILRKGSYVVQLLRGMVGNSQKIYMQVVELCKVKYLDNDKHSTLYVGHKETSYCTLRAQLLMALHDTNSVVAARDRCHELAWTLDAGMTNGQLTDKHLTKLTSFFDELDQSVAVATQRADESSRRRGKGRSGHVQDEAESAGNVMGLAGALGVQEPRAVLSDAAVILRDPSALHLLAGTALQMVLPAALEGTLPRDLPQLPSVLRMMALGMESRAAVKENKCRLPDASALQTAIHDVLPLLGAWALHHEAQPSPPNSQLQGPELPGGDWGPQVPAQASKATLEYLGRSELARRLVQTFTLQRLMEQDWLGACRGCKLLSTLKLGAILEGWDFAGTLAQRLAELIKGRTLSPTCSLWYWAVDNLLVKAVDAHTQVHEEVLRLLLAAAPHLQPDELGTYLRMTLDNSKKSRRQASKKPPPQWGNAGGPLLFPELACGEVGGSDIGSDGWAGIQQLKLSASDGVRSVYSQFVRLPNVTHDAAPALFAYLADKDDGAAAGVIGAGAAPAMAVATAVQQ